MYFYIMLFNHVKPYLWFYDIEYYIWDLYNRAFRRGFIAARQEGQLPPRPQTSRLNAMQMVLLIRLID